jgi:glycosyltransferase involved in cell wall biosynthesis
MFWIPLIYFFFLWFLRQATSAELQWKRSTQTAVEVSEKPLFSVVVACRNEEKAIQQLISCLHTQTLEKTNWELIVVDDHSTDNTVQAARSMEAFRSLRVISNSGVGKKQAQLTAAKEARGEWLCFLDADVLVSEHWLAAIASVVSQRCDLFLLPVSVQASDSWLGGIQQIENQWIMSFTAASAFLNTPILANGANMVVRKSIFFESWSRRKDALLSSGDDMYLLLDIKKTNKERILFVADQRLIAQHAPCLTWSDYFHQRIRWAGKGSVFSDWSAIGLGLLLLLIHASVIYVWLTVLLGQQFFLVAFLFHLAKIAVDAFFAKPMRCFLSNKRQGVLFLFYGLVFPVLFFAIPLFALVYKPRWKDRPVIR